MVVRGTLHDGGSCGAADEVEPAHERVGHPVRRVEEVLAVDGRQARAGRQRQQQRGEVGEPDHPRRLRGGDGVEIEVGQQLDGQLAAPRGDDRTDRRVDQHRLQLGGASRGGGADEPLAVHALAHHHVVAGLPDAIKGDVQARVQRSLHPRGGCGDTDAIAWLQRGGIADWHGPMVPDGQGRGRCRCAADVGVVPSGAVGRTGRRSVRGDAESAPSSTGMSRRPRWTPVRGRSSSKARLVLLFIGLLG